MNTSFENLISECDENLLLFSKKLKTIHNEKTNNSLESSIRKYDFYLVTTILELSVSLKNLLRTRYDWEIIFFTKNSFLTIYESSIHFKNLTEREDLKNYMKSKKISDEIIIEFTTKLNEFMSTKDYKFIESIRNIATAHMHNKINEYYKTIYSLDGEAGAILTSQYLNILQIGFILIEQLRKK